MEYSVELNKRFINLSNKLYNKGLYQTNIDDLTGAIESLNKSIEIYKKNTNARNLLGLLYYKTGNIGLAIKHWVISSSFDREDNLASYYLEQVENHSRIREKFNDSIKMYNKALEYLHQNSEDMAIIQLKKAIELNSNFLEAQNLLVYCYLLNDNKDKAFIYVKNVLSIDKCNKNALSYYNEYFKDKTIINDNKVKKSNYDRRAKTAINRRNTASNITAQFISFVVGSICMLLLLFIFYIPSQINDYKKEVDELKESKIQEIDDKNAQISNVELEKRQLIAEIDDLKSQNEQMLLQMDGIKENNKMTELLSLYNSGKYIEAAEFLFTIDTSIVSDSSIQSINSIKDDLLKKAAVNVYQSGYTEYRNKKYDDAYDILKNYKRYDINNSYTYLDDCLYYMGRIKEMNGDEEEAKALFQDIVDNYSNTNIYKYAKDRLKRLK